MLSKVEAPGLPPPKLTGFRGITGKEIGDDLKDTVKPRHNAPVFNIIPLKEHLSPKKYFHSCLHVGNSHNLSFKYNFGQSLEMYYKAVVVVVVIVVVGFVVFLIFFALDASSHLCERVCPSVRPWVRMSVR